MDSLTIAKKQKILNWVNQIQDPHLLDEISKFMIQNKKSEYDPAFESTLSEKGKIEYWKQVGISGEELFEDVLTHIRTLPWKK